MNDTDILQSFFLIFAGATVIATTALYLRQPMLVAYIALGALAGPFGLALVDDTALLSGIAETGIIFLLFLVGLDLPTQKLKNMLGESLLTAFGTTAVFFTAGAGVMFLFGYTVIEAVVVGIAMTFSSTILGIKLLPTTVLHHRHIGEIVISLLLVQDLLAIIALLFIGFLGGTAEQGNLALLSLAAGLPALIIGALFVVRFVLLPLLEKFDEFHEYIAQHVLLRAYELQQLSASEARKQLCSNELIERRVRELCPGIEHGVHENRLLLFGGEANLEHISAEQKDEKLQMKFLV